MLDAYESRIADLIADRLAGTPLLTQVARARDGLPPLLENQVRIVVRLLVAEPAPELGDDDPEVRERDSGFGLRSVLRLTGDLRCELEIGAAQTGDSQSQQRARLLGCLDRLLVSLHDPAVRSGDAFATDEDLGFEIMAFRLQGLTPADEASIDHRRVQVLYRWLGRFWPVGVEAEGGAILQIPVRIARLPLGLPDSVYVRAGGADVSIPVALDHRELNGATAPRLIARLRGAAPPGSLIGDTNAVPAGSVGYAPSDAGRYVVVYRPPPALAGQAHVRIALTLAHDDRPSVALGEVTVRVTGP